MLLAVLLAACGSRTDGKPGELESDESRRPPSVLPPLPPSCGQEGQARCNEARREVCAVNGEWRVLETCESAAACERYTCNLAACEQPGLLRCTGSKWLRCREDALQWEIVETCDDVTTCCGDV